MTPEQTSTLRSAVAAEPSLASAVSQGDDTAIKNWCNADHVTFKVYRGATSGASIRNAITWANLTPSSAPDGLAISHHAAIVCQGRQINLQILVQGVDYVASGLANIRKGLQDALTDVPSGVAGAAQSAGWPAVKAAMTRAATNAERVFAAGAGTAAQPGDLVFEGEVTQDEASSLR